MLWMKAGHIIFVITWFAALFYLPRLFVYHVESAQSAVHETLRVMQRKLYYYIMWPSAVAATILGVGLLVPVHSYYLKAGWMHLKLFMVLLLWVFHLSCGYYRKRLLMSQDAWPHGRFFRMYNEIPSIVLIVCVWAVVLKPQL